MRLWPFGRKKEESAFGAEGKTFAAKIDPDDPKHVLVLWDGA